MAQELFIVTVTRVPDDLEGEGRKDPEKPSRALWLQLARSFPSCPLLGRAVNWRGCLKAHPGCVSCSYLKRPSSRGGDRSSPLVGRARTFADTAFSECSPAQTH